MAADWGWWSTGSLISPWSCGSMTWFGCIAGRRRRCAAPTPTTLRAAGPNGAGQHRLQPREVGSASRMPSKATRNFVTAHNWDTTARLAMKICDLSRQAGRLWRWRTWPVSSNEPSRSPTPPTESSPTTKAKRCSLSATPPPPSTAITRLITELERLVAAEPKRTDHQHDLAVSHNKWGDLMQALGRERRRLRPLPGGPSPSPSGWSPPNRPGRLPTRPGDLPQRLGDLMASVGTGRRCLAPATRPPLAIRSGSPPPNRTGPTTNATWRSPANGWGI